MTDTDAAATGQENGEATEPGLRVLTQYIRDLSFENPRAPEALRQTGAQPQMDVGVEMNARGRDDGFFEVDLKLTARASREDGPLFHVEVLYGGVFQINGVTGEALEQALLIECPRFLFPFARRIVADVTADGGFPPFLLDPIDFAGIYASRKAEAQVVGHA